jgi:hypothetical protein
LNARALSVSVPFIWYIVPSDTSDFWRPSAFAIASKRYFCHLYIFAVNWAEGNEMKKLDGWNTDLRVEL